MGLFMELGPSNLNSSAQPVYNPYSWNSNSSLLFIDQPINVGLSYSESSIVTRTEEAAEHIYAFLTLFFLKFPEYAEQNFHVAGESYGGHFVPAIGAEITKHEKRNINLRSVAVGNGLTDPVYQYPSVLDQICGKGGYPAVVDQEVCDSLKGPAQRCVILLEACKRTSLKYVCLAGEYYCETTLSKPIEDADVNPYDIRKHCGDKPLCYDEVFWIINYLMSKDVQNAIGSEKAEFAPVNETVNMDFMKTGEG